MINQFNCYISFGKTVLGISITFLSKTYSITSLLFLPLCIIKIAFLIRKKFKYKLPVYGTLPPEKISHKSIPNDLFFVEYKDNDLWQIICVREKILFSEKIFTN